MAMTLMNHLDLHFEVKSSKRSKKSNVVKCAETSRKCVFYDLDLPFKDKRSKNLTACLKEEPLYVLTQYRGRGIPVNQYIANILMDIHVDIYFLKCCLCP